MYALQTGCSSFVWTSKTSPKEFSMALPACSFLAQIGKSCNLIQNWVVWNFSCWTYFVLSTSLRSTKCLSKDQGSSLIILFLSWLLMNSAREIFSPRSRNFSGWVSLQALLIVCQKTWMLYSLSVKSHSTRHFLVQIAMSPNCWPSI